MSDRTQCPGDHALPEAVPAPGRPYSRRHTLQLLGGSLGLLLGGAMGVDARVGRWASTGTGFVAQSAAAGVAAGPQGVTGQAVSSTRPYKLAELEHTTQHLSPAVGVRTTFRHALVVPGTFDNLDWWTYTVDWGTINPEGGYILSFVAELPLSVVVQSARLTFPTSTYYWQQIYRLAGATQDEALWGASDDPDSVRAPARITHIFAPAHHLPRTDRYRLTARRTVEGFEVGEGQVTLAGPQLTLTVHVTLANYLHTLILTYRQ